MIADDLGDIIQNLIDVLRFILVPTDPTDLYQSTVKIAERQTAQTGPRFGTPPSRGGGQCTVTCVGLKISGCNPVVAETKFIRESGSKDVEFHSTLSFRARFVSR